MKKRGAKFWEWADHQLHHRCHDEMLNNGNMIDVQVRLSRTGTTQLFVGVYLKGGAPLFEEVHLGLDETMTKALEWGIERGRLVASRIENAAAVEPGPRFIRP